MKHQQDPLDLSLHLPELRERIRPLISKLVHSDPGEMLSSFPSVDEIKHLGLLDVSVVFLDELTGYLGELRCLNDSHLMDYMSILHQLPVTDGSIWEKTLYNQLSMEYTDPTQAIEKFKSLQLLYTMLRLGFDDLAFIRKELAKITADPNELRLEILRGMIRIRLDRAENKLESLLKECVHLINLCYFHEGADCALSLVARWIVTLDWKDLQHYKKAILIKLVDLYKNKRCQNTATLLYALFDMSDKLVTPAEKYGYFRRLSKLQATLMNEFELQRLYFFAGNYPAENSSRFKESILYYQYSNYFLYRCWDRIRAISRYLRKELSPARYARIVHSIEDQVHDLGNQVSFQNNSYVETLQADYDKIEKLYKKVEELSLTDTLTGLRNRRYLQNNIYHMIHLAVRHQVPMSFAMLDIDHFKLVNDSYGHAAGDYILKELAKLITTEFRKSDIIVRYGGEEFLMLLFDTGIEQSLRILEEVRISVEKYPFNYKGQTIPITISIGISENSFYDGSELDIGAKIAEADKALYKAKNSGRNRICIHE